MEGPAFFMAGFVCGFLARFTAGLQPKAAMNFAGRSKRPFAAPSGLLLWRRLRRGRGEPSQKPAPARRLLLWIRCFGCLSFGPPLGDLLEYTADQVYHGIGGRVLADLRRKFRLQLLQLRGRAIPPLRRLLLRLTAAGLLIAARPFRRRLRAGRPFAGVSFLR